MCAAPDFNCRESLQARWIEPRIEAVIAMSTARCLFRQRAAAMSKAWAAPNSIW